jgi:excisionase family DNA binding protein
MSKEMEDYKKFRDSIFKKWNLPENKFQSYLNKQFDQFPGKLFEKHLLLDFLYQDLETIKPDFIRKGGLILKGKKEKSKQKLDLSNFDSKFQHYFEWVARKKMTIDKELFLGISISLIEIKEWVDPEYEINYLRNQITIATNELESEKLKDGSDNPLFQINNLFKEAKYPDLFNSDINQIIVAESWIAFRSFLKDRLIQKVKPALKDEIIVQAAIKSDKDNMGNITLNFPMNILKDAVKDFVTKEKDIQIKTPPSLSLELYTRKEAAAYLKITLVTLDKWKDEGRITAYRLGDKKIRFRKVDVEALLEEIQRIKFHN